MEDDRVSVSSGRRQEVSVDASPTALCKLHRSLDLGNFFSYKRRETR